MSNSKESVVPIDFGFADGKYDESNPLVLPSKKRKDTSSNKKKGAPPPKKLLSQRERKKLEKTINQKEKKLARSDLWKELEAFKNKRVPERGVSTGQILSQGPVKEKKARNGPIKPKSWKSKSDEPAAESSTDTDAYSTDPSDMEDDSETKEDHPNAAQVSNVSMETEEIIPKDSKNETEANVAKCSEKDTAKETLNKIPAAVPARYVLVSRDKEIQDARLKLPILAEEQVIMETIKENDVIVLCGATGCGKTTQLPQFLYEAGYTKDGKKIGITEPRRVAAISMSKRVAYELNMPESKVSYQIRYEGNATPETEIKFMTDGVLLQEIKKDFELSNYSAVLVDEAHERTVYTDILLGLLSLLVRHRRRQGNPLKLIVMSATLRVDDFANNPRLFGSVKPPVIQLDARQFPVTIHFNKTTDPDFLKAAYRKICKVHREKPAGGILVFVTGQQEVHTLSRWLRAAFPNRDDAVVIETTSDQPAEVSALVKADGQVVKKKSQAETKREIAAIKEAKSKPTPSTLIDDEPVHLDNYSIIPIDEESEVSLTRRLPPPSTSDAQDGEEQVEGLSSDEDDLGDELEDPDEQGEETAEGEEFQHHIKTDPVYVLPLYSLLSADKQARVFQDPPPGHRLVVIATNVAETSLTIPNIRYVVDCGKVKWKVYDRVTGVSSFRIVWTSKASAEQRTGRAGRTGPGFCYRLYSSRVFQDELVAFTPPEILQRPIEDVVLMLKTYLGSTPLSKFPLPTAPSDEAIDAAQKRLMTLEALEMQGVGSKALPVITRVGRWMSRLPLAPRFAKMLLLSNQAGLLPYTVLLVACLSVPELVVSPAPLEDGQERSEEEAERARVHREFQRQFVRKEGELQMGDMCVLLGAVCCLEKFSVKQTSMAQSGGVSSDIDSEVRSMAEKHGVRWKAYREVRQLRKQITDILNANVPSLNLTIDPLLPKPSPDQMDRLRQIVLAGSPFNVARKLEIPEGGLPAGTVGKRALKHAYQCGLVEEPVYIHPSSVLFKENYEYVIFQELHCTAKPYMKGVSVISPHWLTELATSLCRIEGHLTTEEAESSLPPPWYDAQRDQMLCHATRVTFGPREWPLDPRRVSVPMATTGTEALMTYCWFARRLLEGQVVPQLEAFVEKLKATCPTKLCTVSWGMIRPQVRALVSELSSNKIYSRKKLEDKWRENPKFLLESFRQWLKESESFSLDSQWPPISIKKSESEFKDMDS